MAGYRKPRKLYHLTWPEGHELHGLELEMRGLSIDELVGISGIGADVKDRAEIAGRYAEVFGLFASKLVSWTLQEDDGTPVPATAESVQAQAADDPFFLLSLVMAWADAVGTVDIPLPPGSNGGGTSPELSLALANSSRSLPS